MFIKFIIKYINPINTPYIPRREDNIKRISLYDLKAFDNSREENIKPDIDDMAITIIIIGETMPADTAASPRINPPRIDTADEDV